MLLRFLLMFLCYTFTHVKYDNNVDKKYENNYATFNYVVANGILESSMQQNFSMSLTIDKIDLHDKPIYKIGSKENNIEKNITILKDDKDLIVLAAHSGIGPVAYFKNLHKLQLGDKILLKRNNNIQSFTVTEVKEVDKTGSIDITYEDNKTLILTTCGEDKDKQLVVTSKVNA